MNPVLNRAEYLTVIFAMTVLSGIYHAGMGALGIFALSGRESAADWALLVSGFFLPLAVAFFARRHSVVVGWTLIVGCFAVPMALAWTLSGARGDSDLVGGFFWRFAAPSGLIGILLLLGRFFRARPLEVPT